MTVLVSPVASCGVSSQLLKFKEWGAVGMENIRVTREAKYF